MKKTLITLISMSIGWLSFAQTAWDQGELSITHGSPIPNQTWEVSGSFLNTEIPGQGVGGFGVSMNDTSLTVLLAYETAIEGTDTLADAFLVVLQEPGELEPGAYAVDPTPGSLKLFAWFQDVDPEFVIGLLDNTFDFGDITSLNPYLSISGTLDVISVDASGINLNVSGMLVNTSFQIEMISEGTLSAQNSLPVPLFELGTLTLEENGLSHQISGNLNPLMEPDGVGALFYESGDTLSYTLMAYQDQGDNTFDVYAVELIGSSLDFSDPLSAMIPLSADPGIYPRATPVVLKNVSMDSLGLLLQSGDISSLTDVENLFIPAGVGDAHVYSEQDDWMRLDFENLFMANLAGATLNLSQEWFVGHEFPVAVDPVELLPGSELLVGAPFPNPFNSATLIPVELSVSQNLELIIFNILGQEKMKMPLGYFGPGSHNIHLDLSAQPLAGGFYHFQLINDLGEAKSGAFLYLK